MHFAFVYESTIGRLFIADNGNAITHITVENQLPTNCTWQQTPLMQAANKQLMEYLSGVRSTFDLPIAPQGTPFERRVWNALATIPYGQTRTYQQIAAQIGSPNACRAVGGANSRNPILIVIPCHRVIQKNGGLGGFLAGPKRKQQLLQLEGGTFHGK